MNHAVGPYLNPTSYCVTIFYPNPKDPTSPKSFLYWKIRVENCTNTRSFSVQSSKNERFIKIIIEGGSNLFSFIRKLNKRFPTSKLTIDTLPRFRI